MSDKAIIVIAYAVVLSVMFIMIGLYFIFGERKVTNNIARPPQDPMWYESTEIHYLVPTKPYKRKRAK